MPRKDGCIPFSDYGIIARTARFIPVSFTIIDHYDWAYRHYLAIISNGVPFYYVNGKGVVIFRWYGRQVNLQNPKLVLSKRRGRIYIWF